MNKPLLNKVKKFIRENPDSFDMHSVRGTRGCGCIAHHAVTMDGGKFPPSSDWVAVAAAKLDITIEQGDLLFLACAWPRHFFEAHIKAASKGESTVPIAIRRINHFMRTGK